MKKVLFGLVATIILSVTGNAQTSEEINSLSVTNSEKVNSENSLVLEFYKISNFKTLNKDVTLDEQNIELLSLKNNTKALRFKTSNSSFNNVYAIYNQPTKEFFWFFINVSDLKIELFSSDKILLSSYSNINGNVNLNNIIVGKRSPFGACMDAVEEDFTNDFIGWAAWNANPLYAATAAVHCQGCIKKWWACPKAYVEFLGGN
ncbi:ubiquitin family protein [Flavobacterium facile]|uniref:hypothetical protein n=1 Tax=Flavobacterium facile TaxID=2893174 RepID=UPI002E78AFB0|nr:hypothetical protein [Flavobacterium sp. T-12]